MVVELFAKTWLLNFDENIAETSRTVRILFLIHYISCIFGEFI